MKPTDKPLSDEPTFTLETAKEWLHELEDKLWSARQDAAAARFVTGNLLLHLHEQRNIDATALISDLRVLCELLEPPEARAAIGFLDELLESLSGRWPPVAH